MLRIKKSAVIGIMTNFVLIGFYMLLAQFEIESYTLVLFCAVASFSIMFCSLLKICKKKLNLCTIFLILCFLFYFGQFVEFCVWGIVENEALSIVKSFKKTDIVRVAFITLIYVHILQSGMLIVERLNKNKQMTIKFEYLDINIIRVCAWLIYIAAYPFALYYQYSRFRHSKIWGYGSTLYSNLASSSQWLRFGEFFTGFVISMYILLIIIYKGKRSIYAVIVSIIPYITFYVLSGSRLQAALLLMTLVLIRHHWFRPINIKDIFTISIIGIIGSYVITISSQIRNYLGMYDSMFFAVKSALANTSLLTVLMHILDEFGCQIVSIACVMLNCPDPIPFNYGKLYLYGIEIIVPNLLGYKRIFFTENTDDAFKYLINNGSTGLGSSFISESFYSFGFWGIFMVFLFGIIIRKVSQKLENSNNVNIFQTFAGFYTAYCLIFTVRGDTFNLLSSIIQYCLIPILLIWIMNGIVNREKGNKAK